MKREEFQRTFLQEEKHTYKTYFREYISKILGLKETIGVVPYFEDEFNNLVKDDYISVDQIFSYFERGIILTIYKRKFSVDLVKLDADKLYVCTIKKIFNITVRVPSAQNFISYSSRDLNFTIANEVVNALFSTNKNPVRKPIGKQDDFYLDCEEVKKMLVVDIDRWVAKYWRRGNTGFKNFRNEIFGDYFAQRKVLALGICFYPKFMKYPSFRDELIEISKKEKDNVIHEVYDFVLKYLNEKISTFYYS